MSKEIKKGIPEIPKQRPNEMPNLNDRSREGNISNHEKGMGRRPVMETPVPPPPKKKDN